MTTDVGLVGSLVDYYLQQWQDAQHQFADTTLQPQKEPALHAVPAMAVTVAA